MPEIIYKDESFKIIGACFQVYNEMGHGFLEGIYQECLELEFEYSKIPFIAQKELTIKYRDIDLKKTFKPDFICYEKMILEIKSVSVLIDEHRSQILNYLNATGYKLGLLINFGNSAKLEYERFIHT